jgi:hypothetical protein
VLLLVAARGGGGELRMMRWGGKLMFFFFFDGAVQTGQLKRKEAVYSIVHPGHRWFHLHSLFRSECRKTKPVGIAMF